MNLASTEDVCPKPGRGEQEGDVDNINSYTGEHEDFKDMSSASEFLQQVKESWSEVVSSDSETDDENEVVLVNENTQTDGNRIENIIAELHSKEDELERVTDEKTKQKNLNAPLADTIRMLEDQVAAFPTQLKKKDDK